MAMTAQSTNRPSSRIGSGAGATGDSSGTEAIDYLTALRTASASLRIASTSAPYFSLALA